LIPNFSQVSSIKYQIPNPAAFNLTAKLDINFKILAYIDGESIRRDEYGRV